MRARISSLGALMFLTTLMIVPVSGTVAQTPLDQAIAAKFPLTIATASLDDIVTPGAVMTLKQRGILMFATTANVKAQLIYKDGKITPSIPTRMAAASSPFHASSVVQRTYVTNEKLWLVDVKDSSDGVTLQLLSDAVNEVRYTTFLKFPFAKGSAPVPSEITGLIAQVMAPDGGSGAPAAPVPAPSAPSAPAAAAPLPPLTPPPPPPDMAAPEPPTLKKGQTKDEVISGFGQPLRVVKAGPTREIDYYKDWKITYDNGKVSKVEAQ